jgi:hypothetical protein
MEQKRIHVGSRKKLAPKEIIFLKSDLNYTNIYLTNGKKLLVSTTLGVIENRLKDCGFFRTHRSTMVNLDFVENYEDNETHGEMSLFNNTKILVSRRKNKTFKMMKLKFLALTMFSLLQVSCSKTSIDPSNTTKCEKEQIEYEKALDNWITDPTNKTKCEATKSAINTLVNSCSILTAAEKKKYEDELKNFTCN